MVHNGIEYGLMQAYAEGFEILHASEYPLDLEAVAQAWQHGTVIRSWLLELAGLAFEQHGEDLAGHPGLGRRLGRGPLDGPGGDGPRRAGAGHHALAAGPLPQPPGGDATAAQVLAALRQQFGGHAVKRELRTRTGMRHAARRARPADQATAAARPSSTAAGTRPTACT